MNYRKYIAMLKSNKPSRTIFAVSCIALMSTLIGCNVLDTKEDIYDTDEQIKTNYQVLYDFGYAAYTRLQNRFDAIDGNLFAAVSDEAEYTLSPSNTQIFNEGSWNSTNNPDNAYTYNYEGIQAATYFLEKFPNYASFLKQNRNLITQNDINNYNRDVKSIRALRFENRVLRAYFYFELLKRYGGVPLVKTTLSADSNTLLPRNTVDEVVNYIVSEIDASKDSLITNWGRDFDIGLDGRITKGAALALKSRVLLYAASPLYNPTNDVNKWKAAASAANELLSLNLYSLDNSYRDLFLGDRTAKSSETIFAIRQSATNDLERKNYPIGTAGDPRLGYTIVTNTSQWNGRTMEIYAGGADNYNAKNASRTGYYLKKFLNDNLDLVQDEKRLRSWIVFRLAETYLNYAEAMNEAYGPDANNGYALTAKEAINLVRGRMGVEMPAITTASKEEFREKVKHERRIELAFEEHRYWDLRRWKDATTVLNEPLRGVQATKIGNHFSYQVKEVEKRTFTQKMYFYPIPHSEINKSNGIVKQNPGW